MRIRSGRAAESERPFHKLWNFHNKRFSWPIRGYLLAGAAVVTGAAGIACGLGLIGVPELTLMGTVAGLDLGFKSLSQRRALKKARMAIEGLPDADDRTIDTTKALFRRAGLRYRPVIKQQGDILSLSESFNAAVIPAPTGPKKDEILVFVGQGLELSLSDEELASVLAHETAHVTNTPPAQKLLARTTRSVNTALLITGLVTLNPLVCALSVGAGMLRRLFNNEAQKYDEDRADMNGIALFPHESAAEDSLGRIYEVGDMAAEIRSRNRPPGFLRKAANKAFKLLISQHRDKEVRLPQLGAFRRKVDRFYEENGLDPEQAQDEVLGMGPPSSFRFG